jgi:hypothetical protein
MARGKENPTDAQKRVPTGRQGGGKKKAKTQRGREKKMNHEDTKDAKPDGKNADSKTTDAKNGVPTENGRIL